MLQKLEQTQPIQITERVFTIRKQQFSAK
uniref:Uncharacterized protein n=1 Tax=Rhizophora mucronata TaxID=61149 RepID=A0A2P2PDY8_RHIMU